MAFDPILSYCLSNRSVFTSTVDIVVENVGNHLKVVEFPGVVLDKEQGTVQVRTFSKSAWMALF